MGTSFKFDLITLLLLLTSGCQADLQQIDETEAATSLNDLQHHRFVLERVNDMTLTQYAYELGFAEAEPLRKVPELDFGEQGFVGGNTGCNQIRGQASVTGNTLTLTSLASTRTHCPGFAGELELQLLMHYGGELTITRAGKSMILQTATTKLEYQLKDWVQ